MILDLPALTTLLPKETLFVYLAASKEAVSAVLLVVRKGKQYPIHYISRTLHDAKCNYALLEKMVLVLRHVSRRLRRYFEAHPIIVITDQPIMQILSKANTLDGASSVKGSGAGLVIVSPTKTKYTYALRLNFESTNNRVEYEALLAGLRIAKKIRVQSLFVNVDSKLVASQIRDNYEACKENMIQYLSKAKEYISWFKNFKIQNIQRNKNQKENLLSKLASVAFNYLTKETLVETLDVSSMDIEEINPIHAGRAFSLKDLKGKGNTVVLPAVLLCCKVAAGDLLPLVSARVTHQSNPAERLEDLPSKTRDMVTAELPCRKAEKVVDRGVGKEGAR
nr:hypothetical protein [Tanacetum cinerariifolium]GFB08086.1 hypothetical protein [Tanacetum cinerariifolium]